MTKQVRIAIPLMQFGTENKNKRIYPKLNPLAPRKTCTKRNHFIRESCTCVECRKSNPYRLTGGE